MCVCFFFLRLIIIFVLRPSVCPAVEPGDAAVVKRRRNGLSNRGDQPPQGAGGFGFGVGFELESECRVFQAGFLLAKYNT